MYSIWDTQEPLWRRARWNIPSLLFRKKSHVLNKTRVINFVVVDPSCDLIKAIIMKPHSSWFYARIVYIRDDLL